MRALLLAAHGDRGDQERNRWLLTHAATLRMSGRFARVEPGVLNGEPSLEDGLAAATGGGERLAIYPLFMSDGFFLRRLRERLAAASAPADARLMPPLGADPRLPALMLERALASAKEAAFEPARTRLLVVGHGSKFGPANAYATERVRTALARMGRFGAVESAFLEEPPVLRDALAAAGVPTVVVGFFCGEGMHAEGDVPTAIAESGKRAIYTGAVGADPDIPSLIIDAVSEASVLRA